MVRTQTDGIAALGQQAAGTRGAPFDAKAPRQGQLTFYAGIIVAMIGAMLLATAVVHADAAPNPNGLPPRVDWWLLGGMLSVLAGAGLVQWTWRDRHA